MKNTSFILNLVCLLSKDRYTRQWSSRCSTQYLDIFFNLQHQNLSSPDLVGFLVLGFIGYCCMESHTFRSFDWFPLTGCVVLYFVPFHLFDYCTLVEKDLFFSICWFFAATWSFFVLVGLQLATPFFGFCRRQFDYMKDSSPTFISFFLRRPAEVDLSIFGLLRWK